MSPKSARDPWLVCAYEDGTVFELPGIFALGRSGGIGVRADPKSWIPLPQGALLFHLPGRHPIGWSPETGRPVVVREHEGRPVVAAAAFLPPAHTALYLATWERLPDAPVLPLYCYAALGAQDGAFVAQALRVDPDTRQDVALFDNEAIERGCEATLLRHPGNRLVEHLVNNCARDYCCPAARNYVLGRWEAPMPTSPACNADCIGCISYQPQGEIPVTQPRLTVKPSADEIAEMAVPHLEHAPRPVVSFGQGCEGEPLLRGDVLEEAIRKIRSRTSRGVININTNASRPETVARLVAAGLNQIRISLNSARPALYERYYRPRAYTFEDLVRSGAAVSAGGGLVSLNYFIFPGITDDEDEYQALEDLVARAGVHVIQMRNLNIDPDHYLERLGLPADLKPGFGIERWMKRIRKRFPDLLFRYFNPPREDWPLTRRAPARGEDSAPTTPPRFSPLDTTPRPGRP